MHEGMSRTPRRQADEMQTSGNLPSRESEGLNIMLIGYEGGVVAWNMQKGGVDKTFEMTLPPGGQIPLV